MGLQRSAEDFITQARVDGQPLGQFYIVLREARKVGIAFVSAEDAPAGGAGPDIAEPKRTSVLRCALPQEKIFEAGDHQIAVLLLHLILIHLVPLELNAE